MKKIIITERQLTILKEQNKVVSDFNTIIDDTIKKVNIQFSRLAFASIADVMDDDLDLDVITQEMNRLEDIYYKETEKLSSFFDNSMDEKEYWANWEPLHRKLENKASVLSDKINIVQTLVMKLDDIVQLNAQKTFSDIERKEI